MKALHAALERRSGYVAALAVLFAAGLYLRFPWPVPEWFHVDERAFILHPLGFWSGDFNPHFFNYPTLHFYLASALYYLYYLIAGESFSSFVAYRYFVDGGDLIGLARGLNSVLSALTGVVCALIGRRLYGLWGGLWAGVFFAALPLSVRFAHLAIVDVPQALWGALALYFAMRVAEEGRPRDALWGGVLVGLSLATKYPGALAFVPLGLACGLRFGWLGWPLWGSGVLSLAVFSLCSPYVWLDWSAAWTAITAMGSEHVLDAAHASEVSALWHHVRYNLRYGIGLLGLVGLVGGAVVGWRGYRWAEWVLVAGLLSWALLLALSSSVFMRYALPLTPLVVLLWVRGLWLLAQRSSWFWALGLILLAEPLYGTLQTRALLSGSDTRVMAQRWIADNAPPGTYLVHLNQGAGRVRAIHPGGIYIRQNWYLKYYTDSDLVAAYAELATRGDLPPLYVSLNPRTGVGVSSEDFAAAPSHGLLIDYRHPLVQPDTSPDSEALVRRVRWAEEFAPGRAEQTVYDAVDWYFLPIGNFSAVERTGPHIRIGVLPAKIGKKPIPMEDFFALLRDLLLAQQSFGQGDQDRALALYESVWSVPFSLDDTLPPEYMYDLVVNMGLVYSRRGDLERTVQLWQKGIELKPEYAELYNNLGTTYARMNRPKEAVAIWEQALALEPDQASTHYNMGNAYYGEKAYEQAIAAWSRAVDLDDQYTKVHYNIGNAHFNMNQLAPALVAYERAVVHDPENADLHYNIAQVYIKQDDPERAIQALRRSLEYKQDPGAYYQLGALYAQRGHAREARLSFGRLLQLAPDHPKADIAREALGSVENP